MAANGTFLCSDCEGLERLEAGYDPALGRFIWQCKTASIARAPTKKTMSMVRTPVPAPHLLPPPPPPFACATADTPPPPPRVTQTTNTKETHDVRLLYLVQNLWLLCYYSLALLGLG